MHIVLTGRTLSGQQIKICIVFFTRLKIRARIPEYNGGGRGRPLEQAKRQYNYQWTCITLKEKYLICACLRSNQICLKQIN